MEAALCKEGSKDIKGDKMMDNEKKLIVNGSEIFVEVKDC